MYDERFMERVENRFKKFLVMTVQGIRKDYEKKERRKQNNEFLTEDIVELPDTRLFEYDKNILDMIESVDVYNALESLTSRQKNILFMMLIHDCSEANIASQLHITQQCVNSTKKKALLKLKKKLIEKGVTV